MVFLALLAIALGVLLALTLVLVGLVEAPWPVLLIGLLAALYGLQRELTESQAVIPPKITVSKPTSPGRDDKPESKVPEKETNSDGEDVLTYRGIRYRVSKPPTHDSHSHEAETLVEGIYRGQHWQRWTSESDGSPQDQTKESEITYRGHKIIKPEQES
jgi:hypothetical protein